MTWMLLGLVLFLGAHSLRVFAEGWRSQQIERLGEKAFKGLYALVSLAGFVLLCWGYDLARATLAALWRGRRQRAYNINDDSQMLMGDYFDMAAGVYGLPKPPRISRARAKLELGEMQMSFMSESRRLVNTRMKRELRLRLLYPQVQDGLEAQN